MPAPKTHEKRASRARAASFAAPAHRDGVVMRRVTPRGKAASRAPSRRPHDRETLRRMDAYWRAANYLSVGQIYLYANPLLRKRLLIDHVMPRLLGHWGTMPGLNFVYVHFNRVIKE